MIFAALDYDLAANTMFKLISFLHLLLLINHIADY